MQKTTRNIKRSLTIQGSSSSFDASEIEMSNKKICRTNNEHEHCDSDLFPNTTTPTYRIKPDDEENCQSLNKRQKTVKNKPLQEESMADITRDDTTSQEITRGQAYYQRKIRSKAKYLFSLFKILINCINSTYLSPFYSQYFFFLLIGIFEEYMNLENKNYKCI